jgi:hypothetical protein
VLGGLAAVGRYFRSVGPLRVVLWSRSVTLTPAAVPADLRGAHADGEAARCRAPPGSGVNAAEMQASSLQPRRPPLAQVA